MELSFSEILLICVIAFLVFGPEEFVRKSQQAGRWIGKLRTQAHNIKILAEEQILKKEAEAKLPGEKLP
jgi:Sec-independent protein translocase protein TatA